MRTACRRKAVRLSGQGASREPESWAIASDNSSSTARRGGVWPVCVRAVCWRDESAHRKQPPLAVPEQGPAPQGRGGEMVRAKRAQLL